MIMRKEYDRFNNKPDSENKHMVITIKQYEFDGVGWLSRISWSC